MHSARNDFSTASSNFARGFFAAAARLAVLAGFFFIAIFEESLSAPRR